MRFRFMFILGVIVAIQLFLFFPLYFLKNVSVANAEQLKLFQAVMCEEIYSNTPKNPTVVFSASDVKAVCFSVFDPVPQKTVIYHNWFFKDKAKSKVKLTLKSPKWKSISRLKLREREKGPWRVEIRDSKGKILRTLRFSIVD